MPEWQKNDKLRTYDVLGINKIMTKKFYNIEGMHCGACSTGIEMFLSNTEGVKSAKVSYEAKKAEVEYDENKLNDEDIIKTIEEAGFKAKL